MDPQAALCAAEEMAACGADVIDIGGESTAPGAPAVEAKEELGRIACVVEALASRMVLSVDTYKAEVADYCLKRGARMINDVSALRADTDMLRVLARSECLVVIMHSKQSKDHPAATEEEGTFGDVIVEAADFLCERIGCMEAGGISRERIIAEPGMGRFLSSRAEVSWEMLARLKELKQRLGGMPLLVGTSRKGFLGGELKERDALSQLSALMAWLNGADFIRTHNIKMARSFFEAWPRVMG